MTASTYTATGQLASVTTGSAGTPLSTISYCYDPDGDTTAVVYGDGSTPGSPVRCGSSSPWVVSSSSYPAAAKYQAAYSYDSAGEEVVSATAAATAAAPGGATTTETYDPAGDTLTRTDPDGVTTWTYTPLNQDATVSYCGGAAHPVSYGYAADGNKTSMSDATGTSTYAYDPFGELSISRN